MLTLVLTGSITIDVALTALYNYPHRWVCDGTSPASAPALARHLRRPHLTRTWHRSLIGVMSETQRCALPRFDAEAPACWRAGRSTAGVLRVPL